MNNLPKPRPNTCAPRKRTTPTKAERKLAARVAAFEATAKLPGKHEHHKPGSHNYN